MQIEAVLNAGAVIGESATWASADRALCWFDVKRIALTAGALRRCLSDLLRMI